MSCITKSAFREDESKPGEEDHDRGGWGNSEMRRRPVHKGEPDQDSESEAAIVYEEAEDLAKNVCYPLHLVSLKA